MKNPVKAQVKAELLKAAPQLLAAVKLVLAELDRQDPELLLCYFRQMVESELREAVASAEEKAGVDGERAGPWVFQKPSEEAVRVRALTKVREMDVQVTRLTHDCASLEQLRNSHGDELPLSMPITRLHAKITVLKDRRDTLFNRVRKYDLRVAERVRKRWERHWGESWKGA